MALIAGTAHAQTEASFRAIDMFPGAGVASPLGISGDGSTPVGEGSSGNGNEAFFWTDASSTVGIGALFADDFYSTARAANADGNVVVGDSRSIQGNEAFVWTSSTGMVGLGDFPGGALLPPFFWSRATGVSADGTVVVGTGTSTDGIDAFRWTEETGLTSIGHLSPPGFPQSSTQALGISSDGDVIVGRSASANSLTEAFRWSQSTGMVALGDLPGGTFRSIASATNADGSVVVGWSSSELSDVVPSWDEAFRWTQATGMQPLGDLPGGIFASRARDVSADGSRVVGGSRSGPSQAAFLWTQASGMRSVHEILTQDFGLDLTGWFLGECYGISDDGTVLVGHGSNPQGESQGWMAVIPLDDTDDDGLPDDWEKNGIPYIDHEGELQRYLLDSDGDGNSDADWLKKDIFVEVDAMASRAPSAATLQRVVDAFDPPGKTLVPAVAGLEGGEPNITLHIQHAGDRPQTLTNAGNYGAQVRMGGPDAWHHFAIDKQAYFGTATERAAPDAAQLLEAKRKAYRYCIFANSHSGGGSSGLAQGAPSDDFMVTLGTFSTPGGTPDQQAATFMHELGHTLGLRHGGGDNTNFKPNYYSIMNYWWQFPATWKGNAWGLRYSEHKLPALDENALVEADGLGAAHPNTNVPFTVPVGTSCDGVFNRVSNWNVAFFLYASMSPNAAVDWNADCNVLTPGAHAADINDLSFQIKPDSTPAKKAAYGLGRTELRGHNDWLNIHYNVRTTPTFEPGAPAEELFCEYDSDLDDFIASLPLPPGACPGDIADASGFGPPDGFVDFGDFFALSFLAGPCGTGTPNPTCTGDLADASGFGPPDGLIDFGDFFALSFIAGPCP